MQTRDLINALAADAIPERLPARALYGAATGAALVTVGAFLLTMGWRPDLAEAVRTVRFPFKFVVTLALVLSAFPLLRRMADPVAAKVHGSALAAAPLLMLAAVGIELLVLPPGLWMGNLVGSNSLLCLTAIPLLSVPTAAALMLAMKQGAPVRPRVAGAVCGLVAAGIAATIYALHCDDDSPLFVAVWYTLAVAFVTSVSAAIGGRLLRW